MVSERKVGKTVIRLYKGDITCYDGDAIVNAANEKLVMKAGVAGAIKEKGGEEIEDEALDRGPVEVGEAVVTSAGDLPVDYVIHAAVVRNDGHTGEREIRGATQNSLYRCDELSIGRVAFPAFGTGVGRYPVDKCARAMLEEVVLYLEEERDTSLREVAFFLFGEETWMAFSRVLDSIEFIDIHD
ncbi:MAG: macro domain-containing protein [Thermovirgaceae bacterium]